MGKWPISYRPPELGGRRSPLGVPTNQTTRSGGTLARKVGCTRATSISPRTNVTPYPTSHSPCLRLNMTQKYCVNICVFPRILCFLFCVNCTDQRLPLNMTRKYCVNHCVFPEFCVSCFVLTARQLKKKTHGKIVFFLNGHAISVSRYTATLCHIERHENILSICFQCGLRCHCH